MRVYRWEGWGVHPPGILYEYQNKGLTKFALRKLLILKGAFSVVYTNWERYRLSLAVVETPQFVELNQTT